MCLPQAGPNGLESVLSMELGSTAQKWPDGSRRPRCDVPVGGQASGRLDLVQVLLEFTLVGCSSNYDITEAWDTFQGQEPFKAGLASPSSPHYLATSLLNTA